MCLSSLRPGLVLSLRTASAVAAFIEGASRQPSLESSPSLDAPLFEMQDQSEKTYPRRDELTRAFIAESQRTRHPVWATALTIAYLPMLRRLRSRLVSDTQQRGDLDQLVLESFLVAIANFRLEKRRDRAPMYLRQDTQRAVFRALRLDQRATVEMRRMLDELGDEPEADPVRMSASGDEVDEADVRELHSMLGRHLSALDATEDVAELVRRTTLGRENLAAFVRELAPGADEAEHYRLYNRLKRRRELALKRVRVRLEDCVAAE
jgi:hypothetical protein